MNVVQGDLIQLTLDGQFDVIIHGCNCYCEMDKGIAKFISETFPEAFDADKETEKGSREKLGTITFAEVERDGKQIIIVNGYTQHHWRGKGVLVEYDAVRGVMKAVKERFSGKRIGYPKIGAGLAKGDWDLISQIIDEELEGEDHTLVEFVP